MTKRIEKILENIDFTLQGILPERIKSIKNNSREVREGDLFFAIRGNQVDGHDYIHQAVMNRASAIIAEKYTENLSVPQIIVRNSRAALSTAAANYFDYPSKYLNIIGVTGTNGKTTTVYLLSQIFKSANISRGTIGTLGYSINDQFYTLNLTTPDSIQVQEILTKMVAENVEFVAMEVSAHALSMNRVDDIEFSGGIFTNISQDHLDFYGDIDHYVAAKKRLFDLVKPDGYRLSNLDDGYAPVFNSTGNSALYTYALNQKADFNWSSDSKYKTGISGNILFGDNQIPISTKLSGKFNLCNILAATGSALCSGINANFITDALNQIQYVPGRLQEISSPGFPRIFVDYAHTPDAIVNVLTALHDIVPVDGRLITVFGCGGNRDKTKRPLMAKAAASLSDIIIVTTDNPRQEEPEAIIDDAIIGFTPDQVYEKIIDRKQAIEYAIKNAKPKDIVAILGKGHEDYQEIKGVKHPFSDVLIVNELMENK
ncbi:MAG: UDP-N-acetylmuramoyl-L-alanyl-D-glutamate--2,6-diaminopimelate ligase [Candidatus Marinimicrobia bacterium]|nr:UDP-N-acetylmuramoyl-L-alanyl-D-glutamate--2,6-diaminopimelate ligase [Candidatus Neomarinimicrobiota bacterium]